MNPFFILLFITVLAAVSWLIPCGSSITSSLRAMSANKLGLTMMANKRPGKEQLRAFANSEREQPLPGKPLFGIEYLANASRVDESEYVEGVTSYITGWTEDDGLTDVLNAIAPEVPVNRRFEYKGAKAGEMVLSETDDIRGVGADFKVIEYTGTDTQAKTLNKGLTIILDKDNMTGDDAINRAALRLMLRLKRNDLRRAMTALQGLDSGTAKTWDATAAEASLADPDNDVLQLVKNAGDAHGTDPNVVVYDGGSWLQRALCLRASKKAGGFASAAMSKEELATLLNVDRVVVVPQRYRSNIGATPSKVSDLKVMTMFSEAIPSTEDPSCVKRFVSSTDNGGSFAVYILETAKTFEITVEHYSYIVGISGAGALRYNVATS